MEIGDTEGEEKPRYASLRSGQMIETITMDEAMELFRLPKVVGTFEEKDMTVAIGRFGPYVRHNSVFHSLPKGVDPHSVTEEACIEIIKEKRQKDAEKLIKTFDEDPTVKILNGRWGPYIEYGKANVKIPKDKEASELTFEEVKVLAEAAEKEPKKATKKFAKKK